MEAMFKLINSETKPLTLELAQRFKAMTPSPTERQFDQARAKMLREKAEAGQLIAFNWATARLGDKEYRVNGQHSSAVLPELNGQFPQGLKVHMDTYEVDSPDGLALLLSTSWSVTQYQITAFFLAWKTAGTSPTTSA
jgi:hypothetical protein